ncbi:MAG: hypothetical protein RMI78_05565 [Nitrososphaerota archaeon]|nr:hypothetical protein [Nitrososphaerota archaeon]
MCKKRFVRIKEKLYSFGDGMIRVSITPCEEYLEFDISKAWFPGRARGEMRELIPYEKYLMITFKHRLRMRSPRGFIA